MFFRGEVSEGVSPSSVFVRYNEDRFVIKGYKKSRKSRYTSDEITAMRYLYAEGYTYDMLSEIFKCGHGTISYYCVKGHKEDKIRRQLEYQRRDPDRYRKIRNKHRNKYSTKYQRRWRWSKRIKDAMSI